MTEVPLKKYASRAGLKLEHGLSVFGVSPKDKTCADFGSSAGGFVDCLLQAGAKKVYAVETGYGVLDWKLRNDPRVVVLERTNAMHVTLPEKCELITVDTSWTKQEKILPNVIVNLSMGGDIISLIKPHYEREKAYFKTDAEAELTARQIAESCESLGVMLKGFATSPIRGEKGGNPEYLAWYRRAS